MNKLMGCFLLAINFVSLPVFAAGPTHKGISFQGVIKLPGGEYPSVAGVTVRGLVLSPNNCILREEEFSSVNIVKGYINLVIGQGVADGDDPGYTMAELMDNTKVRNSLKCIDSGGARVNGSFNPVSSSGGRKFRIDLAINGVPVLADFNMRAMAYALNSETLNGKAENDFLQVNAAQGVTQTNLEKVLLQTTKIENLLANVNGDGTVNAASSLTAVTAQGLDSSYTVPVTQGGTGATTSGAALQNLLPAQTGKANHYLQTDGTTASWQPVASSGGTITEVAAGAGLAGGATAGTATLSLEELNTQGTYTKVTTDKHGRVITGTTLADSDIPALAATKITSGTLGVDVQTTNVSATNLAGQNLRIWNGTNYLTFTYPAGGAGYGLEWPAMTGVANANMVLQTDGAGKLQWVALPSTTAPAGAAGGDLADNYPAPRVAKIQGQPVDTSAPAAGHSMIWAAGKWTPSFVKMSDVKNSLGSSMMPAANCNSDQAMVWNVLTDSFVCQTIDDDTKLPLAGGTMSGDINMGSRSITATNTVTFTSTSPASPADGSLWYDAGVLKYQNASGTQILDIAGNNVVVDKISNAAGKYFTYQPDNTACTSNQVLKWINNRWECANDNNTPSTYAAGTGLDLTGTTFSVKYGTGAGEAVQGNDTRLTGAFQGTTALGQDLSGTLPNPKVVKINEVPVAKAVAGDDQKFLKYVEGSGWVPHNVKLSELKDSSGNAAFNVAGCTDSQTIDWSSITDKIQCQDIHLALNTTSITGTLPMAKGGTGMSAVGTAHQVLGMNAAGSALEYKTIPTCAANQYITFNGTSYSCVNDAGASGTVASITSGTTALTLSSTTGNITANISDATTAAKGLVQLAANGGTTAATVVQANDSRLADSRAPSGAAGGDLAGNYPAPTLKNTGTAGTYTKVTTDAQGRVTSGTTLVAADIPNLDWAKITTGKPTTLTGYGITDSLVANGGGVGKISSGLDASKPGTPVAGDLFVATDTKRVYRYTGTIWDLISSASGTGGTVTTMSVVAANGLAGTVANATTTPAITLSTTVTGLVKGNGSALSAAASGDVTTALGYTPVNKAGDTVTGNLTFDNTKGTAYKGTSANTATLTGPNAAIGTSFVLRLPATQGTANQVMSVDGSGNLGWTTLNSVATSGTVNNSNWSGAALSIANGGTGATNQAGAQTALGIGTAGTKNTGTITGTVPLIGGTGILADSMCTSDGTSALVCTTPIPVGSQWVTSGTNIHYSTGKVGIGTATPTGDLQISSGNTAIKFGDTTAGHAPALTAGSALTVGVFDTDGTANDTTLFSIFKNANQLQPDGGGITLMSLGDSGNLYVEGSLNLNAASDNFMGMRRSSSGVGRNLTVSAGGGKVSTANMFGGNLILSSGTASGTGSSLIEFKTATSQGSSSSDNTPSTKMTILGNGNVGIGTAGPNSKLDVRGTVSAAKVDIINDTMDVAGNTAELEFRMGGNDRGGIKMNTMNTASALYDMTFWTKEGGFNNERMRIANNGNVGIGTSATPNSKLQVAGTISNVVNSFNTSITCGSTTLDMATSNFIRLSPSNIIPAGSCGVGLANLKAGASYTVVVTGNAATNAVTFNFFNFTFKYLPGNGPTTAGKDTIYTLLYDGTTVYVTWASGY